MNALIKEPKNGALLDRARHTCNHMVVPTDLGIFLGSIERYGINCY